jgi:hypothetical protein
MILLAAAICLWTIGAKFLAVTASTCDWTEHAHQLDEGKCTATTFVGDNAPNAIADERFRIRDRGLDRMTLHRIDSDAQESDLQGIGINTVVSPPNRLLHPPGSDSKSTACEFFTDDDFFSNLLAFVAAQHPQYVALLYK